MSLAPPLHALATVRPPPDRDFWIPRVLIVDDDEDMVELMVDWFERWGTEVHTAHNGIDGLDKIAHDGNYGLVMIDLVMPGIHGLQLATMTRYAGYRVPFIITTAFSSDVIERIVNRLERATLLCPPFKLQELWKTARELVEAAMLDDRRTTGE